jgi:quinoprotein relay system zinc metallohydrolase 2
MVGWIALLLPGLLAAAPLQIVEVAPGVFVHQGVQEEATPANRDGIANIGFIIGDDAVVVIDPGGSLVEGQDLRAAIRTVTGRPIRYVVLTHVHPDHVLGATAFLGDRPEFVGHAKLPGALAQRGEYYVGSLRRALGAVAEGSRAVPPDRLVTGEMVLDLGNRSITIRAHGPAHTDNDLSVFDHATATLWLADLLFVDRIPVLDGSLLGWLQEIDGLKEIVAARAVPGHGPPSVIWPAAVLPQERYLRSLAVETRSAIRRGIDIGAAEPHVGQAERQNWLLFDKYHPRNVVTAYKELEWE